MKGQDFKTISVFKEKNTTKYTIIELFQNILYAIQTKKIKKRKKVPHLQVMTRSNHT